MKPKPYPFHNKPVSWQLWECNYGNANVTTSPLVIELDSSCWTCATTHLQLIDQMHVVNTSSCWPGYNNTHFYRLSQFYSQCRNEHRSRNRSKSPPISSICCSMRCFCSSTISCGGKPLNSCGGKPLSNVTKLGKKIWEKIIHWICNF